MKATRLEGSQGIYLTADIGGNPANPAVIFLHGGGQTRHSWKQAASELVAMDYHVISLDLRGHGESDWSPTGDYSLDAHIADLKAVVAMLETPAVLVGASLGGVISLVAAAEFTSSEISAIILVDVVPRMEKSGTDAIRAFMSANEQGFESVEEAADSVAKYLPHRPRPKNTEGLKKNLRVGDNGRLFWHWDPAVMNGIDEPSYFAMRMEAVAPQLDQPILLLKGDKSEIVSENGVAALQQIVPQIQYIEIDNAAHMVAGDNNDVFNAVIEQFIRENSPPIKLSTHKTGHP